MIVEIALESLGSNYSPGHTNGTGKERFAPAVVLAGDPEELHDVEISLGWYGCAAANVTQSHANSLSGNVDEKMKEFPLGGLTLRMASIPLARIGFQIVSHRMVDGCDFHTHSICGKDPMTRNRDLPRGKPGAEDKPMPPT